MTRREAWERIEAAADRVPDLPLAKLFCLACAHHEMGMGDDGFVQNFEAAISGIVDRRVDLERVKRRERKPVQP